MRQYSHVVLSPLWNTNVKMELTRNHAHHIFFASSDGKLTNVGKRFQRREERAKDFDQQMDTSTNSVYEDVLFGDQDIKFCFGVDDWDTSSLPFQVLDDNGMSKSSIIHHKSKSSSHSFTFYIA